MNDHGRPMGEDPDAPLERERKALKLARMLWMLDDEDRDLVEPYLRILINDGLPRTQKPKSILIIGAGIAGLVAAKLLKDAGHRVKILEANANRAGGRIKTFRFEKSGQYAEAGAMRIPDFHPLTLALVDKLKLRRRLFYNVDINPSTGRTEETPPVVYRRAWDDKVMWCNGEKVEGWEAPDKVQNTWIRTNEEQKTRASYGVAQAAINRGFGVEKLDTSSTLLDRALDHARDYFSVDTREATEPPREPGAVDSFCAPLEYSSDRTDRRNKPFSEWLEGWARLITDFDAYSLWDYLKERELSEREIQLIGTLENLTSRMSLSFMHSFMGRRVISPSVSYWEIVGGMAGLTDELAKELRDDIVFDARVIELQYHDTAQRTDVPLRVGPGGPGVWARTIGEPRRDSPAPGSNEREFTADYALVTIPFSALRFVTIQPMFSYPKRRAIIELHYDSATKVVLEFSKRWWEFTEKDARRELGPRFEEWTQWRERRPGAGPIFGGGSVTDNPNRGIYYPSHKIDGSEGGVILAVYAWSDDARRWDAIPAENRYGYALKGLKALHGDWIEEFYVGGKTQSWALDYYAFGEAAVFAPGQLTQLQLAIPTPEGRVHFAGEHTSLKHAWIEGAIESAIRAALELNGRDA